MERYRPYPGNLGHSSSQPAQWNSIQPLPVNPHSYNREYHPITSSVVASFQPHLEKTNIGSFPINTNDMRENNSWQPRRFNAFAPETGSTHISWQSGDTFSNYPPLSEKDGAHKAGYMEQGNFGRQQNAKSMDNWNSFAPSDSSGPSTYSAFPNKDLNSRSAEYRNLSVFSNKKTEDSGKHATTTTTKAKSQAIFSSMCLCTVDSDTLNRIFAKSEIAGPAAVRMYELHGTLATDEMQHTEYSGILQVISRNFGNTTTVEVEVPIEQLNVIKTHGRFAFFTFIGVLNCQAKRLQCCFVYAKSLSASSLKYLQHLIRSQNDDRV